MTFNVFIFWISFCLASHFFFAAMEMALISVNRIKVKHMADKGQRGSRWLYKFLEDPPSFLSTVMIGENVLVVLAASISSFYFSQHLSNDRAILVSTILLCPAFLIVGEFLPKRIALSDPFRVGLWGILPLKAVFFLLKYPVGFCNLLALQVKRKLKFRESVTSNVAREELKILFQDTKTEDVDRNKMIEEVLEFGKVTVHDVMVPLINTIACPSTSTLKDVKKLIFESGYSRLPVYHDRVDNIVGSVHAIDIIGLSDELSVKDCMDEPYIVPESMLAMNVLKELQTNRKYMAIVVDEYGGVTGIVTLEDLLEEIVGEIEDEYDEDEHKDKGKDIFVVDGQIGLNELQDHYGISLVDDEEYKTLGGLLTFRCGHIPKKGQWFYLENANFEVLETNDRYVVRVKVYKNRLNSV